jgi:DNA-binding NtrC family response regulator
METDREELEVRLCIRGGCGKAFRVLASSLQVFCCQACQREWIEKTARLFDPADPMRGIEEASKPGRAPAREYPDLEMHRRYDESAEERRRELEEMAEKFRKSKSLEEIEREAVLGALKEFGGNRTWTARALGIGLPRLRLMLSRYREKGFAVPKGRGGQPPRRKRDG